MVMPSRGILIVKEKFDPVVKRWIMKLYPLPKIPLFIWFLAFWSKTIWHTPLSSSVKKKKKFINVCDQHEECVGDDENHLCKVCLVQACQKGNTATCEPLTNVLQTSYDHLMNVLRKSYECLMNVLLTSYEPLTNLLWTPLERLMNVLRTSYKRLTNVLQMS
jgi:hypothetical protein